MKINEAAKALELFQSKWCIDEEATKKEGKNVFRCSDCLFADGGMCRINAFIAIQAVKER